jgi:hypothetical protein
VGVALHVVSPVGKIVVEACLQGSSFGAKVTGGVQAINETGGLVVGTLADVKVDPVWFYRPVDVHSCPVVIRNVRLQSAHVVSLDLAIIAILRASLILVRVAACRVTVLTAE